MPRPDPETRVRAALAELGEALIEFARSTAPPRPTGGPVDLLSPAVFARRAGLGRSTTYLAIADGSIRSVKLRGRRLIPSSELARLGDEARPAVAKRPARVSETSRTGREERDGGLDRSPAA